MENNLTTNNAPAQISTGDNLKLNNYLKIKFEELINKNNYDIYINNVGFHNAILDLWFDRKILDMKDLENLSTSNLELLKDILYGKDNIRLNKADLTNVENTVDNTVDNRPQERSDINLPSLEEENKNKSSNTVYDHLQLYIFQDKYTLGLNDIFRESCSMDLFLYLLEYSHDRVLVRRVGYNVRNQKTPRIVDVLYPEYFDLYLAVLENKSELRKILRESKNTKDINYYAYMLGCGEGGERDTKEAQKLYKLNWEENKDSEALFNYIYTLEDMGDKEKARELYKLNWEENKDSSSLHNYAHILYSMGGEKDIKEAQKLFKLNWEENKDSDSLLVYSYILRHGKGGEKNLEEARRLFKLNWEENKNIIGLGNYAYMLQHGYGGEKDEKEARRLFKLNWEENKHNNSLHNYAHMLWRGIGGGKDEKEAQKLFKLNWDKNKNSDSLYSYITILRTKPNKTEQDNIEARALLKLNWEENKHSDSLHNYAHMLWYGIGGEKDEKEARRLFKLNWEENRHKGGLDNYIFMLSQGIGGEKNIEEEQALREIMNNIDYS